MKKILLSILSILMCGTIITAPVFATECPEGCVPTAILGENGCSCDDGKGSGVISVLNFVVNIMTIGIGILAAIGITVVGIQYLTAGGNEEQVRKSKRRLIEIVIGIAAYVVIYALLVWLLPGFKMIGS